ncbi:hypothetical protein P7C70_g4134, partial [Phenoliferia sp. Uapishka_3]
MVLHWVEMRMDEGVLSSRASLASPFASATRRGFVGLSARNLQRIGGRLAVSTMTIEQLEAMGLSDAPPSPVHPIQPAFTEASRSMLLRQTPGLRPGMAANFAQHSSFAKLVAVKKTSLREQGVIAAAISLGRRYPVPHYKKDAPLIFDATRPLVERGKTGKGPFVEVANIPLGEVPKWFAEQVRLLSCRSYTQVRTFADRRLHSAPLFFRLPHLQNYDFGADSYYHSKAVVSKHLGPSGDQMFNPGVRVPLFHWNPLVPAHVIKGFESKGTPSHPHGVKEVFRAFYSCNRACQKFCLGKNVNGRKVYTHIDKTSRGEELKCSTKLKIIVCADNLQNAVIFMRGNHEGRVVKVEFLETSRLLRSYARDQCERLGKTVSTVAQHMIEVVQNWEAESLFVLPLWRHITSTDIKGIFRARGIRNGMIGDPLVALESLSQSRHYDPSTMKDPEARGFVYMRRSPATGFLLRLPSFQPYIPPAEPRSKTDHQGDPATSKPKNPKTTNFANKPKVKNAKALQSLLAVLASASCCDDIIRWARVNGIGIDSSHRHKCENRAPMTVMCSMADDGHVRIGPCAISSDITAETIGQYLTKSATAIEKRAEVIIEAHKLGTPVGRDEADQARLLAEAIVIDRDGWRPSHVMIDKSRSELNAIRTWAAAREMHVNIRLCQFHIIQAILRWSADSPSPSDRSKKKNIKITRLAKLEILDAFRALQRYRSAQGAKEVDEVFAVRSEEEWKAAVTLFASRISDLSDVYAEEDESLLWYDHVIGYFEENWFTDEWRDLWVDHGMPLGQTRDGFWAQNNRTERLFRFFDDVLLGGTCNRRIDHLPLIIIDTLFPYFANFTSTNDTIDETLLISLDLAAEYWESAHFERDLDFERAFWVTPLGASDSYLANLSVGECPCTAFAQTGKRCAHMWAADFQDLNGDYEDYNAPLLTTVSSYILRESTAISGRNFRDKKRSATVPPREPEPWRELTDRTVNNLTTLAFNCPRWKDSRPGIDESTLAADASGQDLEADLDDYQSADFDNADTLAVAPSKPKAKVKAKAQPPQSSNHPASGSAFPGAHEEEEEEEEEDFEENLSAEEALADELPGGADDFLTHPSLQVKTSLPSAGADRGIEKVNTIRRSEPSALKARPKTKQPRTTVFTQKSGPKRVDHGANSLSAQTDLEKLSLAKHLRAKAASDLRSADNLASPVLLRATKRAASTPGRAAEHPPAADRPSSSATPLVPDGKSLYSGPNRVPNSVRRARAVGQSPANGSSARRSLQGPVQGTDTALPHLVLFKAAADKANALGSDVSYEEDRADGAKGLADSGDPFAASSPPPRIIEEEVSRQHARYIHRIDVDVELRCRSSPQSVQEAWAKKQAIDDVEYFEYNCFLPVPTGYGDFHPDGRTYWDRFHSKSLAQRTAVTNAFLQQYDNILTPSKLRPGLTASPRGRQHLTPLTTSSGLYRISPSTMRKVYQMNEWFDDLNMNAALAAINFWLGWQPGMSAWSPCAYVLPTMWSIANESTLYAGDTRLADCRYIIAPSHVSGNHWLLVVACLDDHTFKVYNSMNNEESPLVAQIIIDALIRYLNLRGQFQRDAYGKRDLPELPYSKWTIFTTPTQPCPQQADSSACGPYTIFASLAVALHAMNGLPSTTPILFEWGQGVTRQERHHDARRMRTEILATLLHMRWNGDETQRHADLFQDRPVQVDQCPPKTFFADGDVETESAFPAATPLATESEASAVPLPYDGAAGSPLTQDEPHRSTSTQQTAGVGEGEEAACVATQEEEDSSGNPSGTRPDGAAPAPEGQTLSDSVSVDADLRGEAHASAQVASEADREGKDDSDADGEGDGDGGGDHEGQDDGAEASEEEGGGEPATDVELRAEEDLAEAFGEDSAERDPTLPPHPTATASSPTSRGPVNLSATNDKFNEGMHADFAPPDFVSKRAAATFPPRSPREYSPSNPDRRFEANSFELLAAPSNKRLHAQVSFSPSAHSHDGTTARVLRCGPTLPNSFDTLFAARTRLHPNTIPQSALKPPVAAKPQAPRPSLNPRAHPVVAPVPKLRNIPTFNAPGRKTVGRECLTRLRQPTGGRPNSTKPALSELVPPKGKKRRHQSSATLDTSTSDDGGTTGPEDGDEDEDTAVLNSLVPPTAPLSSLKRPLLFHGPPRKIPSVKGPGPASVKSQPVPTAKRGRGRPRSITVTDTTAARKSAGSAPKKAKTSNKSKSVQDVLQDALLRVAQLEAEAIIAASSRGVRGAPACGPCRKSKVRCSGGSPCAR